MISRQIVRRFMNSAIRRSHEPEGFPGANVPMSFENRYRVVAVFTLFFGSGLAIPFLIVRHQLLK